jgi:transaldolase/glucose-6-phosphate isomerase
MSASDSSSTSSTSTVTKGKTPVFDAHTYGQSIWLDNISRELLLSGELRRWVQDEGIRGVTSNPAIFENAIAKSTDYDPAARALIGQGASDALDVFERLAVQDIQLGCDVLRPVWEESEGRDGFVSLEVSPHLSTDTEGTITEARRLAKAVSRDNLMIKVPATPEGIPAIQQLISDGIHVNVTLLFAVDAYEAVHEAYISGLEARLDRGENVSGIASVASFFISRIDASVAQQIAAKLENEKNDEVRGRLEALNAKVAIANAKLAYARFLETLAEDRWQRLAKAGADPQRVLWASTGTKDPALPKTLYVDELIGLHTVNTLPGATLDAFRKEGNARDALGKDPVPLKAEAHAVLSELDALGISLKEITDALLTKGCALFSDAFDGLLLSVETKRQKLLGDALPSTRYALGHASADLESAAEAWQQNGRSHALWRKQASIFSDADEANWMGWLDLPAAPAAEAIGSPGLRDAVRRHPADTAVVIGMGGSSLWPDVLGRTFVAEAAAASDGTDRKARALRVLDTTAPDALEAKLAELDLERCLFFVSSKSGSTIEPNAIFELVYARLVEKVGADAAGRHFVAITDPGSQLEARANKLGFLGTALGRADVGGRFSALSPFGLLPAEAMGLDPEALQLRARSMAAACASFVTPEQSPGVKLGLALGMLSRQGRDKLTLHVSPEIELFTDWIEQLLAESTGKHGGGIIPIAGEPLMAPECYANDRIFVDLSVAGDKTRDAREAGLAALEAAGHPVIRIELAEGLDLIQEVFQWEMATSVAGSLWALNPFDQPDVESAKLASSALIEKSAGGGALPVPAATIESEGIKLIASSALSSANASDAPSLLRALFDSIEATDTFALNGFVADNEASREVLEAIRAQVRDATIARGGKAVSTTLDFGPRYLHSTGQLQKGGPNRLVGLQFWQSKDARTTAPLAIPNMGGDFDTLVEAQAAGDYNVLAERGRRMIGIDLGEDALRGLKQIQTWMNEALG